MASRVVVSIAVLFMSISRGSGKPTEVYLGYQDSLGQYSFGYSTPLSARSEIRTADGATRGYYSYVDADGRIQSAEYTADANYGFRIAATNLPQAPLPVEETAEVAAARAAHLRAVEMAEKRAAQEAQMQPGSVKDEEIQAEAGIRNEEEELRPFGALALSQPVITPAGTILKVNDHRQENRPGRIGPIGPQSLSASARRGGIFGPVIGLTPVSYGPTFSTFLIYLRTPSAFTPTGHPRS